MGSSETTKSAEEYFLEGRSCAQSIFASFADTLDIDETLALKISAPFGGGVGRMRHICGALSGALMVAGAKFASADAGKESKEAIYALTREIAQKFKEQHGTLMCAEILGDEAQNAGATHVPQERNSAYYAARPCLKVIKSAEKIIQDLLDEKK